MSSQADRRPSGGIIYRISPGLYALGCPDQNSPVLVTCNFKLTFDTVRRELAGDSYWLLVVETYGINVWCAAGKQGMSTHEVAKRVKVSGLDRVVTHRDLILPQLAAPAVAGYKLRQLCGFSGVFGPVRIQDLPRFLHAGKQAEPEMRAARFPLGQRVCVALVKIYGARKPGLGAFAVVLAGFLTGVLAVPAFLPYIPFRAFAAKGLLAGG